MKASVRFCNEDEDGSLVFGRRNRDSHLRLHIVFVGAILLICVGTWMISMLPEHTSPFVPPPAQSIASIRANIVILAGQEGVDFDVPREDWERLLASRSPSEFDPSPAKWVAMGWLNIEKKSGETIRIDLFDIPQAIGAFAVATEDANDSWDDRVLAISKGRPKFVGYVVQHHNIRSHTAGVTCGWQLFGHRVESAVQNNIVAKPSPLGHIIARPEGNCNLGQISNLHSLIPYSLEARRPVYKCTSADELRGAHIANARDGSNLVDSIVDVVQGLRPEHAA